MTFRARFHLVLPVVVAFLLATAQSLLANDWPRFRHDTANGAEGVEQDITQASISSMQLRWQFATGSTVVASPVVATINNVATVFAGSENGTFYALNASTGTPIWTHATGGGIVSAADVDTSNINFGPVVYFVSLDGCVYSANAANGAVNWAHCYGPGVTLFAPLYSTFSGRILIVSYNNGMGGVMQALDENTGATIWNFNSGAPFVGPPAVTAGNLPGSNVLVAIAGTQMLAVNPSSGVLLGTFNLGAQAVGVPVQVVIGSRENDQCGTFDTRQVWVAQGAGLNSYLVPLDSSGGFQTAKVIALGSAITGGAGTFFLSSSSTHTFRDPDTGLLITCAAFGSGAELFYPAASSTLEAVVIQNSGSAAAGGHETVGSSGLNIEPTFSLDESNPFGGSGVVFVPSQGGILYAVTAPEGAVTAVFTARGAIQGSVSAAAGRIYFADNAGYIYAVSPNGQ